MATKEEKLLIEMLEAWEATYKKGQLTLWVFLSLRDGEKYVDEIHEFVSAKSNQTIVCEEQSLYRMLRKFRELKLVDFESKPGMGGPERKYYSLTALGEKLLFQFTDRNISLFYNNQIQKLLFESKK